RRDEERCQMMGACKGIQNVSAEQVAMLVVEHRGKLEYPLKRLTRRIKSTCGGLGNGKGEEAGCEHLDAGDEGFEQCGERPLVQTSFGPPRTPARAPLQDAIELATSEISHVLGENRRLVRLTVAPRLDLRCGLVGIG